MTRFSRTRAWLPAATLATMLTVGGVVAPTASAAPQQDPAARAWEAQPRPVAPQVPGYQINGYNVGKGNYRGAIDPQTDSLWLTNVSPLDGASESSMSQSTPPRESQGSVEGPASGSPQVRSTVVPSSALPQAPVACASVQRRS